MKKGELWVQYFSIITLDMVKKQEMINSILEDLKNLQVCTKRLEQDWGSRHMHGDSNKAKDWNYRKRDINSRLKD